MSFIKYLLHLFTLIIGLSGLAILATSWLIYHAYYNYAAFIDLKFYSPPIVLMIIGSVVFLLAFVGWCGTIRDSQCLLLLFATLIFLALIFEVAIGVFGYIERDNVNSMVEKALNGTLPQYKTDAKIEKTWDVVQIDGACCGVTDYTNWSPYLSPKEPFPHSCCKDLPMTEPCEASYMEKHKVQGCLPYMREFLQSKLLVIGGICLGFALMQLIGILFACSLARSIRLEYETV